MVHRQHHRGGFFGFGPQRRWEDGGEPPLDWISAAPADAAGAAGAAAGAAAASASRGAATSSTSCSSCSTSSRATATTSSAPSRIASAASIPPSPGSVYPTLQMLEDLGYVTATQQEGKKIYSITDEGRPTPQRGAARRSRTSARVSRRLGCRLTPRAGRSDARAAAAGAGALRSKAPAARWTIPSGSKRCADRRTRPTRGRDANDTPPSRRSPPAPR